MSVLENVKIILELEENEKDDLLNIYIQNAQDFIMDYTKMKEIPESLNSIIVEMVVFQFRQKGVENIISEGKGGLSETFITEYPNNIINRLKPYKRMLFL